MLHYIQTDHLPHLAQLNHLWLALCLPQYVITCANKKIDAF